MRKIPTKLREEMADDPYYSVCSRYNENCGGRITWEHVFIYAGKQINEKWAIIPLCEKHHAVNRYQDAGLLDKEINQWISIQRATDEDLEKYPKKDWKTLKVYLENKYG
jgi:hypothetical protein